MSRAICDWMLADSIKISHIRTSSTMEMRAYASALRHCDSNGNSLPKPVAPLECDMDTRELQLKSYLCSFHKKSKVLKAWFKHNRKHHNLTSPAWKKKNNKIFQTVVNNISYLGSTEVLLVMSATRVTKPSLSKVNLDCVQTCGSCRTVNVWVLILLAKNQSIDKDDTLLKSFPYN